MNLIDAIKSGRPFKRSTTHSVFMKDVECDELRQDEDCEALFLRSVLDQRVALMPHDLLADDWENQEPSVTITRSQFLRVCNETSTKRYYPGSLTYSETYRADPRFIDQLAKNLGLEP